MSKEVESVPPKKLLVYCKPWDHQVILDFVEMLNFINKQFSHIEVVVEKWVVDILQENKHEVNKVPGIFENKGP